MSPSSLTPSTILVIVSRSAPPGPSTGTRRRDATDDSPYGYLRFSLLGAWTNTTVLVLGSILVLTEAIPRLFQPEAPNVGGMIVFAMIGIIVNGVAAWRLHGGAALNASVASWHLVEDVLGWIAVLIASVMMLFVDLPILDPILSIAITCFHPVQRAAQAPPNVTPVSAGGSG